MSSDDEMTDEIDGRGEGPKIPASSEMEEALREAAEAVEVRNKEATAAEDAANPDKLTIEVLSTELQELKSAHEEKLKELAELEERPLRLQAEFENFRRRTLKEKQESFKFGIQNLVKDLLSAVDNLERALEHGSQATGTEVRGILDGVELVHREILGAFAKHGVREIETEGQTFDPAFHEAMGQVPMPDMSPNSILQVLQKGYVIHDRMLRPARVIVTTDASQASHASEAGGEASDAESQGDTAESGVEEEAQ